MIAIGLTGGIASGKSLVSATLAEKGVPIVEADKVGHQTYLRSTEAYRRLVEAFGLFKSAKLVGASVWSRFPEYRRYVHPARRRGLEHVWQWRRNQTAA